MSEMSLDIISNIIKNNDMNGTGNLREGPSLNRCPVGKQRRLGHHQKTAKTGWSREMNVAVVIVTKNNVVWKLARDYYLCYCNTFSLVPYSTECTNIFVTEKSSTLFVPLKTFWYIASTCK